MKAQNVQCFWGFLISIKYIKYHYYVHIWVIYGWVWGVKIDNDDKWSIQQHHFPNPFCSSLIRPNFSDQVVSLLFKTEQYILYIEHATLIPLYIIAIGISQICE